MPSVLTSQSVFETESQFKLLKRAKVLGNSQNSQEKILNEKKTHTFKTIASNFLQ